ncbi:MAG: hypothetical protein R3F53_22840 [Gammaproteobacteria bacterium]
MSVQFRGLNQRHHSRSPLAQTKQTKITRLHQAGTPKREIAWRLGIDIKTVRKYITP